MATTPNSIVTPQKPVTASAVATTANTAYGTPTNTVQLSFTGSPTDGIRVTKVTALAQATPTATECQLFISTDGGTTKRFIDSALMAAYTVAQTTAQTKATFGYADTSPLILAAGETLWVAIGVTNTGVTFRAEGYAY